MCVFVSFFSLAAIECLCECVLFFVLMKRNIVSFILNFILCGLCFVSVLQLL